MTMKMQRKGSQKVADSGGGSGGGRHARLALAFCLTGLTAVAPGCGDPSALPGVAGDAAPAADRASFFIQLPTAMGHGPQVMTDLRAALGRHGLQVKAEYSELVGLAGTVSVSGTAADVQELLLELPMLQARAVVLRYPRRTCGDNTCDSDENATAARSATCSLDCGALPSHSAGNELRNSWAVTTVNADRVWPDTQGAGVDVAVLDTGYDHGAASTHPDRPLNLGTGYNIPAGTADYSAVDQHGTHVAGIIAAAKNGTGAVGIAPAATLHIFQVFKNNLGVVSATDADLIAAIEIAIRERYRILNLSLGGGRDSETEHSAVRSAYAAGLLVVAAAGNSEDETTGAVRTAGREFPGAYPESLSVGATSRSESIASFSATGPSVTLAAPGVGVYSTVPVGTGEREVTATFTITGVGDRTVTAVLPIGSSGTGLDGQKVVACGFGSAAEVAACAPLGRVALMQRGPAGPGDTPLPFSDKIRSARLQGALGVILYNHRYGDAATAGAVLDSISLGTSQPIPVIGLAAGDGEYLADQLTTQHHAVTARITIQASDFATFDGTSMATPVVAGVAALVWARYPMLSNVALRQLLIESAVDLGAPGRDDAFGWGRVDALRAVTSAAPRARCGDGRLDPGSEICDGARIGTTSCDDLGYDSVAGGTVTCSSSCAGLDGSSCLCVPGRGPFTLSQTVLTNLNIAGVVGTLARYHIVLGGKPVAGASAVVTVKLGARGLGSYQTDVSDSSGDIDDFNPTQGTGATAGDYTFSPVIAKAGGRCHDAQPMSPASYLVRIVN